MNLPGDPHAGEVTPEPDKPQAAAGDETVADRAADDRRAGRHRAARHRLAESIAEDLLPESSGDERNWGDDERGYSAAWYAENRPPHHDQ